jgi:hypothetical protein
VQNEAVATYQRLLESLTPDGAKRLKAFVVEEFHLTGPASPNTP